MADKKISELSSIAGANLADDDKFVVVDTDATETKAVDFSELKSATVAALVDSAPATLDTLNELAAALGDDPNFATTVTASIADKLPLAGGTMTGNIVMSGAETVDGRDLSVDGSKLDGVENLADVTDTTNVEAAGALMDSEISDLSAVKAINQGLATTDSPTFVTVNATSFVGDGSGLTGLPASYSDSDVDTHLNTGTATTGEYLSWDGSNYTWGSVPTSYADSDVDAHLNYSTATTGQVLSYSGSDYEWVDTASGGGYQFIASVDASGDTSIDFTDLDGATYDAFMFVFSNVTPSTDNKTLRVRYSTDNGASFLSSNGYSYVASITSNSPVSADEEGTAFGTYIELPITVGSGTNEDGLSGHLLLPSPHLAKNTLCTFQVACNSFNSTRSLDHAVGGGMLQGSSVVDAVRFYYSSGNIESGTITMYGMVSS